MQQFVLLLLVTVAVAQASVTITRSSDDGPHPTAMEIEVKPLNSKAFRIPLAKTEAFENLPMTVTENGVSRTFSAHQVHHASHAHYRDIESKSVISVRHVNGKRRLSGHVMHEGTSYFLEPVGESDHSVTKNVRNPELMAKRMNFGKLEALSRKKRQTVTSSTTYTVELHLLIDSSVWDTFRENFGSDSVALSELHLYYTHILNGIDTAYRNIGSPSISVTCIGMTISKTPSDDVWMAGSETEGSEILAAISNYATGKVADHFMAFTRMDITGDGSSSVCGMAYVSGVCKNIRVSINEDQGMHCWGTAAHELGHNLGSHHDGSGNSCDPGTRNLMAPSTGVYNQANVANSYRFSSCSINYMSQYISSLGSSSCLLSAQGTRVSQLASSQREGARMTLDQVCRLAMPSSPGKFFLDSGATSNPAKICAAIYCQTSSGGGTASGGLRAPVGTPCGNQKSCNWNGECSSDSSAPVASDSCFWGDSWPASNCQSWKTAIQNNWDTCRDSVTKGCCKTLAGLC